ncbi:MAG: tRNA 2-selenouridine(34) synthase MnmH [Cyclobacteriaceae bacterium]|nr:tRNA 2-selenouridine(34) synthase MnmH [Cyclobacteriaceae bacterium]UYN86574.1 MAG: tRNA 2-selenouridine(34) synthase MnmH [Cyclobacteriaceae bacterium]
MFIALDEFLKIRHKLPAVDVRSEGEFAEGHIPGVINIPLLNNQERIAVGTDYKQKGQLEAIKTGFRLVGPRLNDIIDETLRIAHGELLVHCWRGGMRSANFCRFVQMAGVKTYALKGGYKAYRQQAVASFSLPFKLMVIGGETGSGKSEILRALKATGEQVIDLEHLALHKGSVFGGLNLPAQPTTEQFQNELFECLLKLDLSKRIWIEDESIAIGRIFLPEPLWRTMGRSPVVEIDVPKKDRIQRLVNEYSQTNPDQFLEAMKKITKKLGGQHFNAAAEKLMQNDWSSTIDILLTYYDKAYRNGLERKQNRVVKRISWDGQRLDEALNDLLNT